MSGNDIVNRLAVIVVVFFAIEFTLMALGLAYIGNFKVAGIIALLSAVVCLLAKKLRND